MTEKLEQYEVAWLAVGHVGGPGGGGGGAACLQERQHQHHCKQQTSIHPVLF
jgi:hypothetical protein